MSRQQKLQAIISKLNIELRMANMVNDQLTVELVEAHRIISMLERENTQLRDRVSCCGDDQEEIDEHFAQAYSEHLQEASVEV